mmetsp:Transcript_16171/g.25863  ORF Transcript_16171/g.25863 Transcript_16171/m.25863 type:complete len:321 (+) Transcript_16171:152-1114(+)
MQHMIAVENGVFAPFVERELVEVAVDREEADREEAKRFQRSSVHVKSNGKLIINRRKLSNVRDPHQRRSSTGRHSLREPSPMMPPPAKTPQARMSSTTPIRVFSPAAAPQPSPSSSSSQQQQHRHQSPFNNRVISPATSSPFFPSKSPVIPRPPSGGGGGGGSMHRSPAPAVSLLSPAHPSHYGSSPLRHERGVSPRSAGGSTQGSVAAFPVVPPAVPSSNASQDEAVSSSGIAVPPPAAPPAAEEDNKRKELSAAVDALSNEVHEARRKLEKANAELKKSKNPILKKKILANRVKPAKQKLAEKEKELEAAKKALEDAQ